MRKCKLISFPQIQLIDIAGYLAIGCCVLLTHLQAAAQSCSVEKAMRGLCTPTTELVSPGKVSLAGNLRTADVASPFGRASLRWPRAVEAFFGRDIARELSESLNGADRYISRVSLGVSKNDFPDGLEVVLLDDPIDLASVPAELAVGCHPGWMVPPSSIYLVASRVRGLCEGRSYSPAETSLRLRRVFLHELGHMIEAKLLNGAMKGDRLRAEGFASWFEMRAAKYTTGLSAESIQSEFALAARNKIPGAFRGTFEDYSFGAMLFSAIEKSHGVAAIRESYKSGIATQPFQSFISQKFSWSLEQQRQKVLQ